MTDGGTDDVRLRERWTAAHGAWNEDWSDFVAVDPGFFERYLDLAAHPWRHGPLEPRIKALEQLTEVFELASGIGAKAFALGAPALREELEA